jgi:hypothetical protein
MSTQQEVSPIKYAYRLSEIPDINNISEYCVSLHLDRHHSIKYGGAGKAGQKRANTSRTHFYMPEIKYPSSVKYLTLEKNVLCSWEFPRLPDTIEQIEFSCNRISGFVNIPANLTILSCVNNRLTSLPPLPGCLIYLDISINLFTILPEYSPDSAAHFDFSDNNITELPSTFNDNIKTLKFNGINLRTLTYDDGLNPVVTEGSTRRGLLKFPDNLQEIFGERCNISKLPDYLPSSLTYIHLQANNITDISMITTCEKLEFVDVCRNNITYLPIIPDSVVHFDCMRNNIEYMHNIPKSIKIFNCSVNNISELPDFPSENNIEDIDVSCNPIKYLSHNNYDVFRNVMLKDKKNNYVDISNTVFVNNNTFDDELDNNGFNFNPSHIIAKKFFNID